MAKGMKTRRIGVAASICFWIAFGLSLYLAFLSASGSTPVGCGPDSGCGDVLRSKWAYFLDIPVSWLAAPIYLALGILSLMAFKETKPLYVEILGQVASLLAICAALWFISLQLFVTKTLCPYCLATHTFALIGSVLFTLARRSALKAVVQGPKMRLFQPELATITVFIFAGICAVQSMTDRPRLVETVEEIPDSEDSETSSDETTHELDPATIEASAPRWKSDPADVDVAALGRPLKLSDLKGGIAYTADEWKGLVPEFGAMASAAAIEGPVIGPRVAKSTAFSLFDYTCHYCRDQHAVLIEAQKTYGDKLNIINLPMPLDASCNHVLTTRNTETQRAHIGACRYARLGLALWRADWRAFYEWDAKMYGKETRPLQEAFDEAVSLVGSEKLWRSLNDPWIDRQLAFSTLFYERNAQRYSRGELPQVMASTKTQFGILRSTVAAYAFFEDALGPEYSGSLSLEE